MVCSGSAKVPPLIIIAVYLNEIFQTYEHAFFFSSKSGTINMSGTLAAPMEKKKKEKHQQETDQTVCVMQISHRVIIFKIPKAIVNLLTKMVHLPLHRRRRRSHPARSPELLCFGVKTHYTALQLPGKLWDAGIPLTVMSSR